MNGIVLKTYTGSVDRVDSTRIQSGELVLDEKCTDCDGLGFQRHGMSVCPGCDGIGFIPTEDGLQMLQFMRRHAGAVKSEEIT